MNICSNCGQSWPNDQPQMRFCGYCGTPFAGTGTLDSNNSLDEELRHSTVLFADLAGFTSISENLRADLLSEVVADVLPRMHEIISRFGGTVEKYVGDAVFSTFGLRRPDPHAARSAVRAGLELQKAMVQLRELTGRRLHLRVGVHSGELMVHRLGSQWGVIGDTVNTASRLQEVADVDTVWISRTTYNDVRRHFEVLPRPTMSLKGKSLPMQPYEVRRELESESSITLPFVGRKTELDLLKSTVRGAIQDKSAQLLLLRGAAGVGKTRLLRELIDWLEGESELFRVDRVEYDRGQLEPVGGLASLIRHRFNVPDTAHDSEIMAALQDGAIREFGSEPSAAQLAFFAFVLGVSLPETREASLGSEAIWTGVYAAVANWIRDRALTHPWVITFEDAQIGDPETAAFLEWVFELGLNAPVIVVVTVRDEEVEAGSEWQHHLTRLVGSGLAKELNLQELPTTALADALCSLPLTDIPREAAERIAEHAEGHPLFALEIIEYLNLSGELTKSDALLNVELPPSVRVAMEARIEKLGLEGKQVAKRAAFIGRRFTREAVARIWDGDEKALANGFEALRRSRVVSEEWSHGTSGELELVFRHGRLQEAARARIPQHEQLEWHKRLEQWARNRLAAAVDDLDRISAEVIPFIAKACDACGDGQQAADWFEALGLLHRKHHRNSEAAKCFSTAADRCTGVRQAILKIRAAKAVSVSGEFDRALEALDFKVVISKAEGPLQINSPLLEEDVDALDRWWELGFAEVKVLISIHRADLLSRTGQIELAEREFTEVALQFKERGTSIHPELMLRWARDYVFFLVEVQGNFTEAKVVREQVAALYKSADQPPFELLVIDDLIASRGGNPRLGLETSKMRLDRALATGNRLEESTALNMIGILRSSLGELDASLEAYEASLRAAQEIGYLRGEAIALHNIGLLHLDRAEFDQARAVTEDYLDKSRKIGNRMAESYAPIYLALISDLQGDVEDGLELIAQGRDAAKRGGWPRLVALASALQGEIQLLQGFAKRDTSQIALGSAAIVGGKDQWAGFDEAGELLAIGAVGLAHVGDAAGARQLLGSVPDTGLGAVPDKWCEAAINLVEQKYPEEQVLWFEQRGFKRAASIITTLADGLVH